MTAEIESDGTTAQSRGHSCHPQHHPQLALLCWVCKEGANFNTLNTVALPCPEGFRGLPS